jgi:hypothetical protein
VGCGFGGASVPTSDGGTDAYIWIDNAKGFPSFAGTVQVSVP